MGPSSLPVLGHGPTAPAGLDQARAAAREFEAVFLATVLDQMSAGLGQGDGAGAAAYRSLLNEEYARAFAEAGGIGLAEAITRELLVVQESSRP
jgi:flagellar protein FlgJ